jgi:hypothetical protein
MKTKNSYVLRGKTGVKKVMRWGEDTRFCLSKPWGVHLLTSSERVTL